MTKEELTLELMRKGFSPDEAYAVSYDVREGLRLLNQINSYDRKHETNS